MNKLATLQKDLVQHGIKLAVIVGALLVLMIGVGYFSDTQKETKEAAEKNLTSEQSELNALHTKLEQSNVAEKRYAEIILKRGNADFEVSDPILLKEIQESKARYRLANAKLTPVTEKISDRPELTSPAAEVSVREGMMLEFDGISDLHVYSFINYLVARGHGFAKIQSLDIERKTDLTPTAIAQLLTGQNVLAVNAKVRFTTVGIQPKETAADAAPSPSSAEKPPAGATP